MRAFKVLILTIFVLIFELGLAQSKPVKIIVMGDNRQPSHNGEQTIAFRKTLEMIENDNPDYIFHTGDFIRGYTNNSEVIEVWYDEWFELIAPLKDKIKIAPGNHDIWSENSLKIYEQKIGKTYYSVDIGPAHLVLLNSWFPNLQNRLGAEQISWLEKDLAAAQNKKFRFVFVHSPAYPSGPHKNNSLDVYPDERDAFWALLERMKVNVLFCGHEHLFNDHKFGKVRQIITGGAGSDLYGKRKDGAFYHYLRLNITNDD